MAAHHHQKNVNGSTGHPSVVYMKCCILQKSAKVALALQKHQGAVKKQDNKRRCCTFRRCMSLHGLSLYYNIITLVRYLFILN